jgi:hypothetical protein
MKQFFKSILLLSLIYVQACTYKKAPEPKNAVTSNTTNLNTAISYSVDIKPLLVTYCLGQGSQSCHVTNSNQGASGDFTTYGGLDAKVNNGTIQSRVFNTNGGMPPSYSTGPTNLSLTDLQKFKDWVSQGAKNN